MSGAPPGHEPLSSRWTWDILSRIAARAGALALLSADVTWCPVDVVLESGAVECVVHHPPERVVGDVFPAEFADRVVGSAGELLVASDGLRLAVPREAGSGETGREEVVSAIGDQ